MRRSRKGGLTRTHTKVYNNNINNIYRVISIHNKNKKVLDIGMYKSLETAKLVADDVASKDNLKCYVHNNNSNRVLYIAGE